MKKILLTFIFILSQMQNLSAVEFDLMKVLIGNELVDRRCVVAAMRQEEKGLMALGIFASRLNCNAMKDPEKLCACNAKLAKMDKNAQENEIRFGYFGKVVKDAMATDHIDYYYKKEDTSHFDTLALLDEIYADGNNKCTLDLKEAGEDEFKQKFQKIVKKQLKDSQEMLYKYSQKKAEYFREKDGEFIHDLARHILRGIPKEDKSNNNSDLNVRLKESLAKLKEKSSFNRVHSESPLYSKYFGRGEKGDTFLLRIVERSLNRIDSHDQNARDIENETSSSSRTSRSGVVQSRGAEAAQRDLSNSRDRLKTNLLAIIKDESVSEAAKLCNKSMNEVKNLDSDSLKIQIADKFQKYFTNGTKKSLVDYQEDVKFLRDIFLQNTLGNNYQDKVNNNEIESIDAEYMYHMNSYYCYKKKKIEEIPGSMTDAVRQSVEAAGQRNVELQKTKNIFTTLITDNEHIVATATANNKQGLKNINEQNKRVALFESILAGEKGVYQEGNDVYLDFTENPELRDAYIEHSGVDKSEIKGDLVVARNRAQSYIQVLNVQGLKEGLKEAKTKIEEEKALMLKRSNNIATTNTRIKGLKSEKKAVVDEYDKNCELIAKHVGVENVDTINANAGVFKQINKNSKTTTLRPPRKLGFSDTDLRNNNSEISMDSIKEEKIHADYREKVSNEREEKAKYVDFKNKVKPTSNVENNKTNVFKSNSLDSLFSSKQKKNKKSERPGKVEQGTTSETEAAATPVVNSDLARLENIIAEQNARISALSTPSPEAKEEKQSKVDIERAQALAELEELKGQLRREEVKVNSAPVAVEQNLVSNVPMQRQNIAPNVSNGSFSSSASAPINENQAQNTVAANNFSTGANLSSTPSGQQAIRSSSSKSGKQSLTLDGSRGPASNGSGEVTEGGNFSLTQISETSSYGDNRVVKLDFNLSKIPANKKDEFLKNLFEDGEKEVILELPDGETILVLNNDFTESLDVGPLPQEIIAPKRPARETIKYSDLLDTLQVTEKE